MLDPITSKRVTGIVQSDIRAMTQRCVELNGINLGQGVCDTPPPQPVIEGVLPAIQAGHNSYTRFDGIARLRQALAGKLQRDYQLDVNPEENIVVTLGTTGAFACTINALCNPGDRILLMEPYYGYHLNTALVAGLKPELVATNEKDFSLDIEQLRRQAKGARAIVVNTPANPSGHVFSRQEMTAIAEICQEYNLLCITDEIYEYFVYDNHQHLSMATLPGMWDRTVTISGYSKTFSITGWRIGYLVAPAALTAPIGIVNDLYYACAPAPLQHAVADAIDKLSPEFYTNIAQEYQLKRDRFCGVLSEVGLTPHVPQGAYYVLTDVSKLGCDSAKQAAMMLLEQAGVTGIPGSAFFSEDKGEYLVRFCFAKDDKTLHKAENQLMEWAEKFQG